ncbi:MAG: DUF1493 family protein [Pyrinomonadaceae bacterium]|nr:DUF1493 family protein [Pyrinomonadaceae bacterium]
MQNYRIVYMDTGLLEEVKDFVAEVLCESKEGWSAETSINDDLGVDGDDGAELMQSFGERFAVDTTAFPYDKFFGPEAGPTPLTFIAGITLRVTKGRWSMFAPLTIGDLVEAAERGSWMVESPPDI